jgi:hypothetical protein
MTTRSNFLTDIDVMSQQYSRFMVSRVVLDNRDSILEVQYPADLPDKYFVELSLYSRFDNTLVFNETYDSEVPNQCFVRTLQYTDEQVRKLLFVDFSKVPQVIPLGEYTAVFNFFTEELGNNNDPPLFVQTISPSRAEVELELMPAYNSSEYITKLAEMASPQINSQHVQNALKQLFGMSADEIPADNTVFTYGMVTASMEFPAGVSSAIVEQTEEVTADILTTAYNNATLAVAASAGEGKTRFTDTYLRTLLVEKISEAYAEYVSQQPSSQFTLV